MPKKSKWVNIRTNNIVEMTEYMFGEGLEDGCEFYSLCLPDEKYSHKSFIGDWTKEELKSGYPKSNRRAYFLYNGIKLYIYDGDYYWFDKEGCPRIYNSIKKIKKYYKPLEH